MLPALFLLPALLAPVPATDDPAIEAAFRTAHIAFDRARPSFDGQTFGVELYSIKNALVGLPFESSYWGGTLTMTVERRENAEGPCRNYAAFVSLPPEDGAVTLAFCPEFFTPGTEALRALTVLHELVHAVAGPDECLAMAFSARVEYLAVGQYTPVEPYWRANNCAGSGYALP